MKNKNKGFTLVETLAVLVILAIMAMVAVPAMTGFIEDAKKKSYIAEATVVCTAVQTYINEEYALNGRLDVFDTMDQLSTRELGDPENALHDILEGSYTEGAKIGELYLDDNYVPLKFMGLAYFVKGYRIEIRPGQTVKATKISEKD